MLSSCLLSKKLKVKTYRTIILPVVLYGCEAWSLTLREEHRLRVFENKVLRKIFGAKRDEITREWRKFHNFNKIESTQNFNSIGMLVSYTLTCAFRSIPRHLKTLRGSGKPYLVNVKTVLM